MCRVALGLAVALGLSVAAGAAAAQEFDDSGWSRVDIGGSRTLWISSEDLGGVDGGGHARARVLWTHPAQGRLPRGTRYVVSDYAFDCGGGVSETVHPFDVHDQPLQEVGETPEREVDLRSPVGAVFAMVCQGADYESDVELGSVREVMDYEASGHAPPAAHRPPNRWNQGPGEPDREPVEPSDSDREPSGGH